MFGRSVVASHVLFTCSSSFAGRRLRTLESCHLKGRSFGQAQDHYGPASTAKAFICSSSTPSPALWGLLQGTYKPSIGQSYTTSRSVGPRTHSQQDSTGGQSEAAMFDLVLRSNRDELRQQLQTIIGNQDAHRHFQRWAYSPICVHDVCAALFRESFDHCQFAQLANHLSCKPATFEQSTGFHCGHCTTLGRNPWHRSGRCG